MSRYPLLLLLASLVLLAGCGGGGGGGAAASSNAPTAPGSGAGASAANVLAIAVEPGPANTVNVAFATVTLCPPGNASDCQSIDHVLIDTASTGLRILSSAVSSSLSLPQQADASGNPVAACAQFADGFSWGPVKLADVRIAGEQANSLPLQVIGDPAFSSIPRSCSSRGVSRNTVQSFGANGVLGVSAFRQDCGSACVQSSAPGVYYSCPSSGCLPIARPLAQQLQNPVTMFAADNNGVIIELPAVPSAGAARVDGSLVFGIGTQANNGLGTASVYALDSSAGTFTTVYKNATLGSSFIDSGSNALFFRDASITSCSGTTVGFYCPVSTQSLTGTIQGTNRTSASINFSVASASSLIGGNPDFAAFSNLGGPLPSASSFDWGLPFFFGRNVFVAIEGASTPGGSGPYVAF